MLAVGVGVKQGDGHRSNALFDNSLHDALDVRHIERHEHLALEAHPLLHLKAQPPLYQRGRLLVVEVVEPRRPDPHKLQHVAEPLGGYQRRPLALALQDRVGCHGKPVADLRYVCWLDVQFANASGEAVQHRQAVVLGRAGDLSHEHPALRA